MPRLESRGAENQPVLLGDRLELRGMQVTELQWNGPAASVLTCTEEGAVFRGGGGIQAGDTRSSLSLPGHSRR